MGPLVILFLALPNCLINASKATEDFIRNESNAKIQNKNDKSYDIIDLDKDSMHSEEESSSADDSSSKSGNIDPDIMPNNSNSCDLNKKYQLPADFQDKENFRSTQYNSFSTENHSSFSSNGNCDTNEKINKPVSFANVSYGSVSNTFSNKSPEKIKTPHYAAHTLSSQQKTLYPKSNCTLKDTNFIDDLFSDEKPAPSLNLTGINSNDLSSNYPNIEKSTDKKNECSDNFVNGKNVDFPHLPEFGNIQKSKGFGNSPDFTKETLENSKYNSNKFDFQRKRDSYFDRLNINKRCNSNNQHDDEASVSSKNSNIHQNDDENLNSRGNNRGNSNNDHQNDDENLNSRGINRGNSNNNNSNGEQSNNHNNNNRENLENNNGFSQIKGVSFKIFFRSSNVNKN